MDTNRANGFTMVELLIVIAVIAILAAFAIPFYQQYGVRAQRTDVQTAMIQIAQKLEAYKLANNDYGATNSTAGYATNPLTNPAIFGFSSPNTQPVFPQNGTAYYTLTITASPTTSWILTATPRTGTTQAADGPVKLNELGHRCWTKGTTCTLGSTTKWD